MITGENYIDLVEIEGASKYLDYSIVTYNANSFLGIEKVIKHGVVSSEVATRMAEKIINQFSKQVINCLHWLCLKPIHSGTDKQCCFYCSNYKNKRLL